MLVIMRMCGPMHILELRERQCPTVIFHQKDDAIFLLKTSVKTDEYVHTYHFA